jgi:xylose isomerase
LTKSPYKKIRADRYASFDAGSGAAFEKGALKLEDLHQLAMISGEPTQRSGKQEWLENIINDYI